MDLETGEEHKRKWGTLAAVIGVAVCYMCFCAPMARNKERMKLKEAELSDFCSELVAELSESGDGDVQIEFYKYGFGKGLGYLHVCSRGDRTMGDIPNNFEIVQKRVFIGGLAEAFLAFMLMKGLFYNPAVSKFFDYHGEDAIDTLTSGGEISGVVSAASEVAR